MGLITLIGRCNEANHRNPADGYECMDTMTDRIFMLVLGFTKSDAAVGEYPVTVFIFLTFGTGYSLEKGRVSYEYDFISVYMW